MGKKIKRQFTDEFKREALRILKTSGRTIGEVSADLGIGQSTLGNWKRKLGEADLLAGPHDDLETEVLRLKRENELLRQERDILKKATAFFAKEIGR